MSFNLNRMESDKDIGTKIVLFLISPFVSLLYSLKTLDKRSSLVVAFLFCVFFGLSFTVTNIREEGSPDGVSYRALFEDYGTVGEAVFISDAQEYFSFSGTIKDYYANTIAYVVSRVTGNYHIFFMVIATIFALFQLKTLTYLTRHKNYISNFTCLLLVFLFTFVSIKNINGLRFWTAYWVAIFSVFKIIIDNKKQYLLLVATLPFFHASYVVVWLLLGLYFLTGRFGKVWSILLILSLFFGNVSLAIVRDSAGYLPDFLLRFVDYYASEEVVARMGAAGSGFYLLDRIFPVLVNVYLNIMLLIIIKNKQQSNDSRVLKLLAFTIILVSFSNFVMPVPSLGKRFMVLSYPLIAYLWLAIIGVSRYRNFLNIMPIVFFMSIYHLLQAYIQNVDPLFYISSPIVDLIRYL